MLMAIIGVQARDTGPADSTGSATSMVIPYSNNGSITLVTNSTGALTSTRLLGHGSASSVVIVSGNSFTLDGDSEFVFLPMPFDGKITAVSGRYSTVSPLMPTTDLRLYIAVALADNDSRTFTVVPESKALAEPFLRNAIYDARTIRTGMAEGLDISVPKGTNIAVYAGYETSTGVLDQTLPFNFSGSIAIEKT